MDGSIEIVTRTNESIGYPGVSLTRQNVPVIIGALAGITGMQEQTPQKRPSGRTPVAQWSGKDRGNQTVTVMLWPAAPAPPVFPNPEDGE